MNNKLSLNPLWHIFYPFFLTFIVGKLILQTDLIFATHLGVYATAAFSVPLRVSIIDTIFAFSLAPVVSVLVAECQGREDVEKILKKILGFTLILSLVLTLLGFIFYPQLINLIIEDEKIQELSISAVIWFAASIPMRFLGFSLSMAMHGVGRGKILTFLSVFNFILNIFLNYIFIYVFNMGFSGIYISTFLCSVFHLFNLFICFKYVLNYNIGLTIPNKDWSYQFLMKQISEVSRLLSARVVMFLQLFIISSHSVSVLSIFSICSEFYVLLSVPLIALMRSISVALAKEKKLQGLVDYFNAIKDIDKKIYLFPIVVSILLLVLGNTIGTIFYGIDSERLDWWTPFIVMVSISFPLHIYESLQRGAFHAAKRLKEVAFVDTLADWIIVIPFFVMGIYFNKPYILWSAFALGTVIKIIGIEQVFRRLHNYTV